MTIPVAGKAASGVEVVLPNGSKVPDEKSPTGWLMAPTADLRSVALAGRNAGILFKEIENDPDIEGASWTFIGRLGVDLGHGGKFDYQRQGNFFTGYSHFRQFADVSNFNVVLYCQQAGLSFDETLGIAGEFAKEFSSNAKFDEPYGLDSQVSKFITRGYEAGTSGAFDQK